MKSFRKVYLPIDFRVMQLLYAVRILWWGIGGAIGLDFAVHYLDYLRTPMSSVAMFFIGAMGVIAAWKRLFWACYVFHIFGVFMFGMFSYSFFLNNFYSVAGMNYFIEMAGFVYLTMRIKTFPLQIPNDLDSYQGSPPFPLEPKSV